MTHHNISLSHTLLHIILLRKKSGVGDSASWTEKLHGSKKGVKKREGAKYNTHTLNNQRSLAKTNS